MTRQEYQKEWVKNNREKANAYKRKYYAKNPELYRAQRNTWRKKNPERALQSDLKAQAKVRAKDQNVPFDLTLDDIVVPEFCPVLGIKLERNDKAYAHYASPTLDKIIPEKGYVKDNIAVISHRANVVKGSSTLEELKAVLDFYSR